MTDIWAVLRVSLTICTQKSSFRTLSYEQNCIVEIQPYTPCVNSGLKKYRFFLIKAAFKCVFRRKDLTLVLFYAMIFFSIKKLHQKLYTNNEILIFSKFQHKITGKLCDLGKNWRQYCVNETNLLQKMWNVLNLFEKEYFFGQWKK